MDGGSRYNNGLVYRGDKFIERNVGWDLYGTRSPLKSSYDKSNGVSIDVIPPGEQVRNFWVLRFNWFVFFFNMFC